MSIKKSIKTADFLKLVKISTIQSKLIQKLSEYSLLQGKLLEKCYNMDKNSKKIIDDYAQESTLLTKKIFELTNEISKLNIENKIEFN